jgi:hypothetical protein
MIEQDEVSAASAGGHLRALHRLSVITTHEADPAELRAVRMHRLTGRAARQTVDAEDVDILVPQASL